MMLHELGVLFYELRLFDRAVSTLQSALDAAPSDDTLYFLAASTMRAGNQEIGIQLASELINRRPDYVNAYTVRGEGELARGYVDRARDDALRVLDADPVNYAALVLAGDVEVAAGNPASAAERYREALIVAPAGIDAIDHLAALHFNQSAWAEYVALVEPHLGRDDAVDGWRERIIDALLALGEVERALVYKSALAEARPRDYELHRDVARLALNHPGSLDAETVLEHARRAVEYSGGSTLEYRILLVDALLAAGRFDEASTQLDTAEEAWPNSPDVQDRRRRLRDR
jgi:tetratricopeptide (TPR) repeat protein